jgi:hypothetical protein
MLSGTSKSLTCRSVGSGTQGNLGGHYICGRGAEYIVAGECISYPTGEG